MSQTLNAQTSLAFSQSTALSNATGTGNNAPKDAYAVRADAPTVYSQGTMSGQINAQWNRSAVLGGSADAYALNALTDALGQPVAFAAIKRLYVLASSGNAGNLTVGGGTNAWLNALPPIPPGGVAFFEQTGAGFAVSGSNVNLQISGSSGDKYEIALIGV